MVLFLVQSLEHLICMNKVKHWTPAGQWVKDWPSLISITICGSV